MVGEIKPCAQNADPDLPILFAASHEYRRFRARDRQPEFTVSSLLTRLPYSLLSSGGYVIGRSADSSAWGLRYSTSDLAGAS
jgi:hypothetical protein